MATAWIDPLLFAMGCLGGGGVLLSLWLGFASDRRTLATLLVELLLGGMALAAGAFALVAGLAGQPVGLWGSAAALVGLYWLVVVLPSATFAWAATCLVHGVRSRAGRRATMLAVWVSCPFLALGLVYHQFYNADYELKPDVFNPAAGLLTEAPEPNPDSPLTTDLGHTVLTLHVEDPPSMPTPALLEAQDKLIKHFELHDTVIHLPLGWQNTNCHGYVFTNGQYWVSGKQVDMILDDNGYRPVSVPQAGDLAIYRDADGHVLHSGIVRGLAADGVILVESKWGQTGRFIHRHDRHCYGDAPCTFYRSARQGHLLRGVYPVPSVEPSPMPVPATGTVGL